MWMMDAVRKPLQTSPGLASDISRQFVPGIRPPDTMALPLILSYLEGRINCEEGEQGVEVLIVDTEINPCIV